jgi:hypothetical protein
MKKLLGLAFLVTTLLAGCVIYVPRSDTGTAGSPAPEDLPYDQGAYDRYDRGVSDYYAYLGTYGIWVSYAPYGYVWIPRGVQPYWRPYTRGHWIWTDYGWTWVSGERWGWLVHHYGRWGWHNRLGWFWVPGTVWGPSWVAWRWGDAYIGWAPIPPGYDFDPSFGFRRRDFDIPGHYWNFVRGRYFADRSIERWILPYERNSTIMNYTHIDVNLHVRGNRVINDGVGVDRVGRMTNQVIERHQLKDAQRPDVDRVEARDLVTYRPELRKSETARPKEVLNENQAVEKIDTERTSGRFVRRTPQDEEATVRQYHDQERKRLEQDQQAEVQEIRRQVESAKPVDRQKAETAAKTKIAEVEKRHAAEKAQMVQRQKEEEDKVKRSQIKKKEGEEKY